ncbi:MAG: hypothetical protein IPG89_05110 [Bacteroidetes bacterium]|nr:hypothetical protein [Bacteroidota bacterium]
MKENLFYILFITLIISSCNQHESPKVLNEQELAELEVNIESVNNRLINTKDSIQLILDSVELKIQSEGLTKTIYTLNMHHEKYLDNLQEISSIVLQSIENVSGVDADTLRIPYAKKFSETYSTSKFYQAGIGNTINQNNYWINRVFHDKSFFAVFSDSSCPPPPTRQMQYLKEATPESIMSLGEFYLLLQKSILKSNELSLEAYRNIIHEYYKNESKKFFPQDNSLQELKYGHGWFSSYKGWTPEKTANRGYLN